MGRDEIGWNFPPNNDGREDGLNDPGIETFRDNPLRSVAREATQNAADAGDAASGKPVEIHFQVVDLPIAAFPQADEMRKILASCQRFWASNSPAEKFFKAALKLLDKDEVPALKISDFNTTGLRGPFGDRKSEWYKLTKAVGASDKATGASGSFGIGKHAPFACSDLRTVLYCTRDAANSYAFQGVSKLVTHLDGRKTTQGTGYYGLTTKNQPITDARRVDKRFKRTEVGTDVWVLGFRRSKRWEDEILRGLIESFFVSIHEGRLVARVGSTVLNKSSLPTLIERYAQEDEHWAPRAYYEALVSEDASLFTVEDFEGYGRVELRVLANKSFPKRVAMVRSSGMLIYAKSRFQTPVRFAGVFQAKGEKLNALLKSLEPPSHDKWEDKRGENPAEAHRVLTALNRWITDQVHGLTANDAVEELDVDEVSQYLPDDFGEADALLDPGGEGEATEPAAEITVQMKHYDPRPAGASSLHEVEVMEYGGDEPGTIPDVVIDDAPPGPPNPEPGPFVPADGPELDLGQRVPRPGLAPLPLRAVRVFCKDPAVGRYRVLAEPEASGTGYLFVNIVGEVGQEPAPIVEVWVEGEQEARRPRADGAIGPLPLTAGRRTAVDIVLEGALHCALGVSARAA